MTNLIGLKLKGIQGSEIEVVSFFEKFNMYQCKETKNNIETSPLLSESEINELIESQSKIIESEKVVSSLKEIQDQEQKEIEDAESIGEFKKNDPKQHAKAKAALNKQFKYNDKWYTRKEYVLEILNNEDIQPLFHKKKWYFENIKKSTAVQATKTEIEFYIYLKANYHHDTILPEATKQQLIKQYIEVLAA